MKPSQIPNSVRSVIRQFRKNGFQSFLVGGAVRDLLLKKTPKDWDIGTDATPDEITRLFPKSIPTGKDFGTMTVFHRGLAIQCTTFRTESDYADQRRPSNVRFSKDVHEDLSRRDFTINAMAYDLISGLLVDPFGGKRDLQRKVLRTVGRADDRFAEDTLRPIRAARFIAQLGFKSAPGLKKAALRGAPDVHRLSAERVRDEITRILQTGKPSQAIRWLLDTEILEILLPELVRCKGVRQGGWHHYDVFHHTLRVVDASPVHNVVRLAALLHDIAKPQTKFRDRKGIHFYGHDRIGAEMADRVLHRLRFPKEVQTKVHVLIRNHLFEMEPLIRSDSALRRFVRKVGQQNVEELLELRLADALGTGPGRTAARSVGKIRKRLQAMRRKKPPLSVRDLAIGGGDVMRLMGVPPGPLVGKVLDQLLEDVLNDPKTNTKRELLKRVKSISRSGSIMKEG